MIVVVDASVLVAELLRRRGRELLARPDLQCLVAEDQWDEAQHELDKRVAAIVGQGRLTSDQGQQLLRIVHDFVEGDVIDVVPRRFYEHMENAARRRVPRDPADWAPVALALALDVPILTADNDFLGCGCPTWTVETLLAELGPP
jgi:predicted nucleic acid-binding protein